MNIDIGGLEDTCKTKIMLRKYACIIYYIRAQVNINRCYTRTCFRFPTRGDAILSKKIMKAVVFKGV